MSDFGDYAGAYEDEIASALAFVGQDPAFFVELKADLLVDLVRRHWGDPSRARVLDVGCGPGGMDSYLVGRVGLLHGVDTSERMVARAARRNPKAIYDVCDPRRLPFDDASFDVAFASCVLHHVDPPERPSFAAELRRILRPGGLVALLEHNPLNPLTRTVVARCEFDKGAKLLRMKEAKRLLAAVDVNTVGSSYIVFVPWRRRLFRRIEERIGFLPLGAQYVVTGRRP